MLYLFIILYVLKVVMSKTFSVYIFFNLLFDIYILYIYMYIYIYIVYLLFNIFI